MQPPHAVPNANRSLNTKNQVNWSIFDQLILSFPAYNTLQRLIQI